MWCPSCRGEYREGTSECPRCGMALTESPPPLERRWILPFATTVAIAGVSASFAARMVGTFLARPTGTFLTVAVAVALIAHLAMAFFVVVYTAERARSAGRWFTAAAGGLLVLLVAAAAVNAGELAVLLGRASPPLPPLRATPWLSLLILAGAVLFLAAVRGRETVARVRRAATVALVAAGLSLAAHLTGALRWYLPPVLVDVGLAVHVLAWAGLVVFLVTLRHELRSRSPAVPD